ncbi:MAG: acetylxylan esterase [Chitinophagaceae bacterium BSSC1]|nr:MAG: acetylxylan esterase [Chitinophagaceae bacterium BSSC1]
MKIVLQFCCLVLLFLANDVTCQTNEPAMPKNMDLYLLIGQSNMAGRGNIEPAYAIQGNERLWMLTKQGEWLPAKHPLHFDKPNMVGVGPSLAFGLDMLQNGDHPIGLIPCAVGGSAISSWLASGFDAATNTHPFDDAVIQLKKALTSGQLKGIIWHQGEADSSPEKRKDYLAKLAIMINAWRGLVNNPNLPFVAGEIGAFNDVHQAFNIELNKLPSLVTRTAVASSKGLIDKGDHLHFDAASATELGKRFAIKMKQLQEQ